MKPPKPGYRGTTFAGGTDPNIRIDPSPATADRNVVRGPAPRNPDDNEQGMRKGGKVTAPKMKATIKAAPKPKGRRK